MFSFTSLFVEYHLVQTIVDIAIHQKHVEVKDNFEMRSELIFVPVYRLFSSAD